MTKHIFKRILLIILLFTAALILWLFFLRPHPRDMQKDFQRLETEDYGLVYLSMYPIDNYNAESMSTRYGTGALLTSYEIPSFSTLKSYLKRITEEGKASIVYLGVLPERLDGEKLAALLSTYPQIKFEVLLSHPSMDYWLSLSEQKCSHLLQAYREFIPPMQKHSNISLHYFGSAEWLITNPACYVDSFMTTAEISNFLMHHTDEDTLYNITYEQQLTASVDTLEALILQYRNNKTLYPDLSGWNIIFFGDSVIGNYTDTTGIPNVTSALTGAHFYNMGYGGTCMTKTREPKSAMTDIASALTEQNPSLLPENSQAYQGLTAYLEDAPTGQHCFVINYGLNDYFSGRQMLSEEPYDIYTFEGATRTSIRMLKEAYPDALILLNTPNYTSFFENGMEVHNGHVIEDYVNALIAISAEMDVLLLDNYHGMGANAENLYLYSNDGCHPNEAGRFLIAQRIALVLGKEAPHS